MPLRSLTLDLLLRMENDHSKDYHEAVVDYKYAVWNSFYIDVNKKLHADSQAPIPQ